MKILVFIGARAGSKGVKAKNIRLLLGKPLMSYTIGQALKWGKAARVIVSTDSEHFAKIARKLGAEVPFLRPAELASDTASKGAAIRHALVNCEKIYNEKYDAVMDLDVTAPIRTVKDIDNCFNIFKKYRPKTLFSVVVAHKNPYFNMVEINKKGNAELSKRPKKKFFRRQDAPAVYAMNASIYFYRRDHVLKSDAPPPFSDDTRIYIMDEASRTDIDHEIDFQFIEFMAKKGLVKL